MARSDEERRALRQTERFGGVNPDAARRASSERQALRNRNRRADRVQPETTSDRRSNRPVDTTSATSQGTTGRRDDPLLMTTEDEENLARPSAQVDGPQGLRRRVGDHTDPFGDFRELRQYDDGGTAVLHSSDRDFNNRKGGTVNTISREAFVADPTYTGFVTPEQQAAREAPVRREIAREQRQAEIDSDMEWRKNLRDRQLMEDANLKLSGDMSLTELADAAGRRRAARATLNQREELGTQQATATADRQAREQLERMKEDGRNRRKAAELEGSRAGEVRKRQIERSDRAFKQASTFSRPDGDGGFEDVHDPRHELRMRQLATSEGINPDTMREDKVTKLGNMTEAMMNIEEASGASIESLEELQDIVGYTNETLLPDFIDAPELIFIDEDGQEVGRANINDVIKGNNHVRRIIDEVQTDNVRWGVYPNAKDSKWSAFGQSPDSEFERFSDPEAHGRRKGLRESRQEAAAEAQRRKEERIGRRQLGDPNFGA